MSILEKQSEAFKLSKELIGNNDKMSAFRVKIKDLKESIKAFDERNEVIMGELRVHTEDGECSAYGGDDLETDN